MYNLAASQRNFLAALLVDEGEVEQVDSNGLSAQARMAVYRNNVLSNSREALRAVYPVVDRLVGATFFSAMCDRYLVAHGSQSGDLHDYGQHFGAFIANYPPAGDLLYLPDVAGLEWQCHRVFHATDHLALDSARLTSVAPQAYERIVFSLHPATALLQSVYPVLRIWQVNQADFAGDQQVDLDEGGVNLLVSRERYAIQIQALRTGEYAFVKQLRDGVMLGTALERALDVDADFDLQATLARLVANGVIVDFVIADAA